MNLYFDIDGVLKGSASPKEDVEALVLYCLQKYSHSVYWLTTHCKGGINNTRKALNGIFSDDLLNQIEAAFKPTDWDTLKTDAIDFTDAFVWFDDTVLQAELEVIDNKLPQDTPYGLFLLDKRDPLSAQDALEYLKIVEQG